MLKKVLCIVLALLLATLPLTACEKDEAPDESEAETDTNLEKVELVEQKTNVVAIQVQGYGSIIARLRPDVAPITVENFQNLVAEGFYDGLIFHRVIKDFMIQGGDPDGNGTGGSGKNIKGEFASNGVNNTLKHERGTLSMARSNAPNSASSQFFICHQTRGVAHLDGEYAAFGTVLYGMEVVDAIAEVKTGANDKPLTDVVIQSIRFATLKDAPVEDESEAKTETDVPFVDENIEKVTLVEEQTDLVAIQIKDFGTIIVELSPTAAPITVENFKKLVSEKFYDGLIFHRVIENFMIQGGAPKDNSTPPQTITGEFSSNGVENPLKHVRGTVSMARVPDDPNSASSQFFICQTTEGVAHLDGNYAAFGTVLFGMEIVDKIAAVQTNLSSKPLTDIVITSIQFAKLK